MSVAVVATAAPKLRLSTTTVGPVFITAGQNGSAQTINAANTGDGSLSLSASYTASWLNVSFGVARACALSSSCVPVNIGLTTSALTRGTYTGIVTVNDSNAIDAPQTFTVTVQIGSAVPDSIDLYAPPSGSASTSFTTGSALTTNVINTPGGPVVAIAAPNVGSFATAFTYTVSANAPAAATDTDFQSTIAISGSGIPGDNRTFPVKVHVTTQPIAAWSPQAVEFRIAQGGQKQTKYVSFSNSGQGTLTLSSDLFRTVPSWLTPTIQGNLLVLTADPANVSVGSTSATVSVNSNAKNGVANIPVTLTVVAQGPPVTTYQGVVDNALFKLADPVAPGGIVALFGEQLTTGAPAQASSLPLGTILGGASVLVNDKAVPVYYVSAQQINFLMPYATPAGQATVRVDRDGQRGNTVSVAVAPVVPRILRLGIGDYAIAVLSDVTFPIPTTQGLTSRPARAGETIVFYALGLGQTNPPAQDGVAAPAATVPGVVRMILGQSNLPTSGINVVPDYAGLTPGFVGLYQINVTLPGNVPRGDLVSAMLDIGGSVFSNRVYIAVQ